MVLDNRVLYYQENINLDSTEVESMKQADETYRFSLCRSMDAVDCLWEACLRHDYNPESGYIDSVIIYSRHVVIEERTIRNS